MECKYEKGECTGPECPCEECARIRILLAGKSRTGQIKVIDYSYPSLVFLSWAS